MGITVDDFMATHENTPVTVEDQGVGSKKTNKKRKSPDENNEEFQALRDQAKSMCSCAEQWKTISKYKKSRLSEWIAEHQFIRDKQAQQSISDGVHNILALGIDFLTGGRGHVQEALCNDISWKDSVDQEVGEYTGLLSNKARLVFLTGVNTAKGKKLQRDLQPTIEPIIEDVTLEEKNGHVEGMDHGYRGVEWPSIQGDSERRETEQEAEEEANPEEARDNIDTGTHDDHSRA